MSYNKKSGNGSKLKRSSKAKSQKCKTTYPNISFDPSVKKVDWSKKKKRVCEVSFKKEGVFIKEKIKKILIYPLPSYRSHKYLVKNTVLETLSGEKIRLTNIRSGALLGEPIK